MKNRRRKSNNNEIKQKIVTRCKIKMSPVFESDTCKDFSKKESSIAGDFCKNCKNSF